MKRVGIFGGSFNPIHNGHLGVARAAVAQGAVDEVWLMLSPQNPLKRSADLPDECLRFRWVERAVEGEERLRACDFELALPRPSYTWKTLEALTAAYPDCDFSLVIGGDNWEHFRRWARWATILQRHRLIVYPRSVAPLPSAAPSTFAPLPPDAILLDLPLFPYSSTEVRRRLAARLDVADMLPPAILEECRRVYAVR